MPASAFLDPSVQHAVADVYDRLSKLPISAVLAHRRQLRGETHKLAPLIAVPEDATIGEIMLLLRNEGILALPVYREMDEGAGVGRQYTGIISIYDILAYTVFQKLFDSSGDQDAVKLRGAVDSMMEEQDQYFGTPVRELIGKSFESKESWSLHSSTPLSSLLQLFTTGSFHRALILDDEALRAETDGSDGPGPTAPPEGSFTTMVTQSDMLHFLADFNDLPRESLSRIINLPCKDLDALAAQRSQRAGNSTGAPQKPRVVTVPDSVTALQAFREMYTNRVSAVAVIDKEGGLAANLSASDLRGLSSSNLGCLFDNVYTFLEIDTRRRSDQIKADQLKFVTPDTPLVTATDMMRESRIHRVWIADDGDKPVGVVTLSDVLSVFVPDEWVASEQ
ncbi:hypothetical protein HDU86_002198 [Geranomyces michiganensis]|nr:hypothetical protein HDU86_002198 [Geranomyces michiganensis]